MGCGGQNAHNCPKILFSEANMLTREIFVFVCMNRAISRMRGVLVMVLWPFMGHFTPPTPCHGHNTSINNRLKCSLLLCFVLIHRLIKIEPTGFILMTKRKIWIWLKKYLLVGVCGPLVHVSTLLVIRNGLIWAWYHLQDWAGCGGPVARCSADRGERRDCWVLTKDDLFPALGHPELGDNQLGMFNWLPTTASVQDLRHFFVKPATSWFMMAV